MAYKGSAGPIPVDPLTIWDMEPQPCVHELRGEPPHASLSQWYACVLANGNPGFRLTPAAFTRGSNAARQARWRNAALGRLIHLYGGFCGANAPLGTGCGANGSTPLELAHVFPTGLEGRGRSTTRRIADVRRYPFRYCLLCKRCHSAFDRAREAAEGSLS